METHHLQQQQQQQPSSNNSNDQLGDGSKSSSSSFLCRQSSTRWTPTTDQIRILKDLYYNNGIRSPSAEQIQKISAKLRQYGKIEGKNVFYWFQNHKARERQKKRFTTTTAAAAAAENFQTMQRGGSAVWRSSSDHHQDPIFYNNKYHPNSISSPAGINSPSASSPAGMFAVGHMGNYGYGSSVAMEKSFRDCSISSCGNGEGPIGQNYAWIGVDSPYPTAYSFLEKRPSVEGASYYDQHQEEQAPEIETLPLFPMHGEDISSASASAGYCTMMKRESAGSYFGGGGNNNNYGNYGNCTDWFRTESNMGGANRASLELTLNSYCGRSTQSP